MESGFQLALAGLIAHAIESMKRSPRFSFITPATDTITKIIAFIVALLAAVAIETTWVIDPVTQLGTLTLKGIPTTVDRWALLAITTFQQYWFQKAYYLAAIKPYRKGVVVDRAA